jgi:ribonuclease HI
MLRSALRGVTLMTESPAQAEVIIYTDGACDPNPGPGGWAALLLSGQHRKVLTGHEPSTTNNRMELQAIIAALQALKQPCQVRLHTDSEYVQKGVTQYLDRWKAKGWRTSDKKAVANRDLWEALDAAMQRHQVEWLWVKGHAGDPYNEEVDRLSVGMIPRSQLPLGETGATHLFAGASCLGAAGPGGWAAVIRSGEATRELSGREEQTSANRLHLVAVVRGLEALPAGATVHVYTPSDYVAQGAERWLKGWARNGWRTQAGQAVRHAELWQAIQRAGDARPVHWHCLKTEATRPEESRRADAMARAAAR